MELPLIAFIGIIVLSPVPVPERPGVAVGGAKQEGEALRPVHVTEREHRLDDASSTCTSISSSVCITTNFRATCATIAAMRVVVVVGVKKHA